MTDMAEARPRAAFRTSFYGVMGILILLTGLAGFAGTYFVPMAQGDFSHPNPVIHLHTAVAVMWLVIFIAQAHLVANRHVGLHRRLGMAGAGVAVLFVLTAIPTTYYMITTGLAGDDPARRFFAEVVSIAPITDLLFFVPLVAFAVARRKQPQVHKRMMLIATCFFVGPGTFRLVAAAFGSIEPPIGFIIDLTIAAFFLAGPVYDKLTMGRVHKTYWLVVPALLVVLVRMPFAAESGLWLPVVEAIARF